MRQGTYGPVKSTTAVSVDPNSVSAGGPYSMTAGSSLTLTITADGAPTTAEVDLGQETYTAGTAAFVDNSNGTATSTITLSWAQLVAAGINGTGTFTNLTAKALYPTDPAGVPAGFLISAPTSILVTDAAPTATFSGSAVAGGTGSVSFTNQYHPLASVAAAGFLYSYDIGDTGTFQVVKSTSPTFAIPADDLYQAGSIVVRGRITDEFGSFTDYVINVSITDQPPAFVTFDANKTVNENALVSLTSTMFSDPTQANLTASINWGDGTTTAGTVTTTNTTPVPTTGTVAGSHAYGQTGTYSVTVTLSDADGEKATKCLQVTVLNPALVINAGPPQTVNVGSLVSLTQATFSDPSAPLTSGSYTATVNWGDGTTTDVHPLVSPPGTPADLGECMTAIITGSPAPTR